MIQFHHSIPQALKHSGTWAGIGGVFTSLGTQLDKPYALHAYGAAALCGILAAIIKSPNDGEGPPQS